LTRLRIAVSHTPGVAAVAPAQINQTRDAAAIAAYPTTSPESEQTARLVNQLRDRVIPPIVKATHVTVDIGGSTATGIDFSHVLSSKLPLFVGIVIALSALLLLIPLQGAAMNLLSIGASLGVAQAVFERGWLSGLFGVQSGPIEAFIPVLLFAIVFGLSMDYEVFLVSRIHEQWLERRDSSAAIREGVVRSGRVIAAAASVMVVVFASFAANPDRVLKLFGVALASAVFLDALVVRLILLPAVLQLLGRRTWTLPSWLDRKLPHLAIEPHADAQQAQANGVAPRSRKPTAEPGIADRSTLQQERAAWTRRQAGARVRPKTRDMLCNFGPITNPPALGVSPLHARPAEARCACWRRVPASAACRRNSPRTAAADHGRPQVGPSITQNSGPTGISTRSESHGRRFSQPHPSIPTSRRRPPLPQRTSTEPRCGSRSRALSASASWTRSPPRQSITIIARSRQP
jgi:MMPL family